MPVRDDDFVDPKKISKFHPVPDNKYHVQITDVNEEERLNNFSGEKEKIYNFEFTILDNNNFEYTDQDGEKQIETTRGRRLWRKIPKRLTSSSRFRASLLYEVLTAVEGKQLAQEELKPLNPNTLIGQQLAVFVSVNGEYNNIESFMKTDKELEPVPTVFERQQQQAEETSTGKVESKDPDWIDNKQSNEESDPKKGEGFIEGLNEDKRLTPEEYAKKYYADNSKGEKTSGDEIAEQFK